VGRWVHGKGELSIQDLISRIKDKPNFFQAGALALFIGVVRGVHTEGRVTKLKLEAYEEGADAALEKICRDLRSGKGIVDVQIHHFLGEFTAGEDLVYVGVAGSHRREVFTTLLEAVERYKREAPIFKKETLETGKSYWVSESGAEHGGTESGL